MNAIRVRAVAALRPRRCNSTSAADPYYSLFPITFPRGPPPAGKFTPGYSTLHQEFSAMCVPKLVDPFDTEPIFHTLRAYLVLADPTNRARYLLERRGIEMGDLSPQMDIAMQFLEQTKSETAVQKKVVAAVDKQIAGIVAVLDKAFKSDDLEAAKDAAKMLEVWKAMRDGIIKNGLLDVIKPKE